MGVINAISAIGVSLIVGIMKVVNFAHGELYIFAGYFSYHLSISLGLPPLLAMPLAVFFVFLLGILMERALIRPTYGDEMYSLIITFVLSIVLQNAALLIFGPYPNKPPSLVSGATNIFGLFHYGNQRLLSFGISIGILIFIFYLIKRTWFGKSIRAISQDRGMASLMGVDHLKVNMVSFGLGAAHRSSRDDHCSHLSGHTHRKFCHQPDRFCGGRAGRDGIAERMRHRRIGPWNFRKLRSGLYLNDVPSHLWVYHLNPGPCLQAMGAVRAKNPIINRQLAMSIKLINF